MRDTKITAEELFKALKEIKDNPADHHYSQEEVDEFLELERQISLEIERFKGLHVFEEVRKQNEEIKKMRQEMPERNHHFFSKMKYLTSLGWYVSPHVIRDISLPEFADLIKEENVLHFQDKIVALSDVAIPRILTKCGKQFPARKVIFEEIREAFNKELYCAVISLSYSQVDGISNDSWGFGFFDKDKHQDYHLKSYINLQGGTIGINTGVAEQLGITSNEIIVHSGNELFNDSDYKKNSYNRHLVIHGHSVGYGTKINAIRAIYLLDLLSYFNKPEGESVME
ncbi:MAG: hypothetical protein ACO1N0_00670 [Fluviicola sp.]